MAAMGQGQASGGEGAAEGQGESQGQQAQGGADVTSLAQQLEGMNGSLEEMRSFLSSNPWAAQEAQQEAGGDEIDLSFLDDPVMDPAQQQQRLNETLNAVVDQRAQQLLAPIQEQQQQMRRDQQARDLAAEFPELATAEMANKIAGRGGLAEQMAAQLGRPELAAEPSFWRMAYMASKASDHANTEGSSDPGAAHLESGRGATPGPSEADLVKEIMDSDGRGSSVLNGM